MKTGKETPDFLYITTSAKDQLQARGFEQHTKHTGKQKFQPQPGKTIPAVIDHQGRFVYTGFDAGENVKESGLAVYSLDDVSGKLTLLPELMFRLGFVPTDLAIDTGGEFLYAVNQQRDTLGVFSINHENGALMLAEGRFPLTGKGSGAIALDPVGRFSFVANSQDNSVSVFTHRRVESAAMFPINRQGSCQ